MNWDDPTNQSLGGGSIFIMGSEAKQFYLLGNWLEDENISFSLINIHRIGDFIPPPWEIYDLHLHNSYNFQKGLRKVVFLPIKD